MNAPTNLLYFPGAMEAAMCDRIVGAGEGLELNPAVVATTDGYAGIDISHRNGLIGLFPTEPRYQWLFDEIWWIVDKINNSNWKFELSALQPLQYSIYREGDFFGWHRDNLAQELRSKLDEPPEVTRKLSFSIQLSDPSEYEGGFLEIHQDETHDVLTSNEDDPVFVVGEQSMPEAILPKGTIIAFPSIFRHRVTPVRSGTRRALVLWAVGPPDDFDGY